VKFFDSWFVSWASEGSGEFRATALAFCLLGSAFFACLLTSLLVPGLGVWLSLALIGTTILVAPPLGFGMVLLVSPIQQFPGTTVNEMRLIVGLTYGLFALRVLPFCVVAVGTSPLKVRAATMLFSAFTFLVIVHNANPLLSQSYWIGVGFTVSILVIITFLGVGDQEGQFLKAGLVAIAFIAVSTVVYDAFVLYYPLPQFAKPTPRWPTDRLRLAGLHSNPLATAKFLLLPLSIIAIAIVHRTPKLSSGYRLLAWIMLGIFELAIVATASKSVMLAFLAVAVCLLLAATWTKHLNSGAILRICWVIGAFVLCVPIWALAIAPPLKLHAATSWLIAAPKAGRADLLELACSAPRAKEQLPVEPASNQTIELPTSASGATNGSVSSAATPVETSSSRTRTAQDAKPSTDLPGRRPANAPPGCPQGTGNDMAEEEGWIEKIKGEFRVGKSFKMEQPDIAAESLADPLSTEPRSYSATKRDCGLRCTGQRDLLWSAGWEVVQDNWGSGVGFGAWKAQLHKILGYPFDSPHNGLLEVWGEFGLAGLVLYVTFAVILVRKAWLAFWLEPNSWTSTFAAGCSLFFLGLLITELFEGTKFFAISPHAIWIWSLLVLQERAMLRARAVR